MKRIVFSFLGIFLFLCSFAQTPVVTRDLETWSSVAIEAGLGSRWDFGIEEQLRLQKNSTSIDEYFTNGSIRYTIIKKHLYIGMGYRFISDMNDDLEKDKEQRFNIDLTYKHSFNQLRLNARFRYTNRDDIGETKEMGDYHRHNYRFRLKGEYKIKNWKFDPVFSAEIFRQYEKYTIPYYENLRLRLGTDYNLGKFGTIEGFYQIDKSLGLGYSKTIYVICIGYKYDFGNLLK
ncbi:MAG: hypothetical protein C0596_14760 [Marinilabiliales bacterium]|nr:MAG: hypothetical protein C0596_14760 [Marinilabiliales bacterium]